MICKKCGKNNTADALFCDACGNRLDMPGNVQNGKFARKQTDSLIVALIIILILLLVLLLGTYICVQNSPSKISVGGGGGAPYTSGSVNETTNTSENQKTEEKTTVQTNEEVKTESSIAENVTEEPKNEENTVAQPPAEKAPEEVKTEVNTAMQGLDKGISTGKKDEFLAKAGNIEIYEKNNLDVAQNQHEINRESAIVYEKWDALLNEVYQYLKKTMSSASFKKLQQDERAWVQEKENAVAEAGAEWGGGSGEPMARNMTASGYTKDRCYYLISLIK